MVYTADEILKLFNDGHETYEIAAILHIPEAEAYNVLAVAREIKNVFKDHSNSAAASLSKQVMAHDPFGWDVPKSKVRSVAKRVSVDDSSPDKRSKDNRILYVDFKGSSAR